MIFAFFGLGGILVLAAIYAALFGLICLVGGLKWAADKYF